MKTTQILLVISGSLAMALLAGAVTPTPKTTSSSQSSPAETQAASFTASPPPAEVLPSPNEQPTAASSTVIQANQPPPKPEDLGLLWFALEEGVIPPSYVYIELNDRQTNTKYKSNLADTT